LSEHGGGGYRLGDYEFVRKAMAAQVSSCARRWLRR
jgi:hypothetical protein